MKSFDNFCSIPERSKALRGAEFNGESLRQLWRTVPLFEIPISPQFSNIIPKEYGDEEIAFLTENFFLPFETIVVEDNSGLVLLADTEPEQRGLKKDRQFVTVTNSSTLESRAGTGMPNERNVRKELEAQIARSGHYTTIVLGRASVSIFSARKLYTEIETTRRFIIFDNGNELLEDTLERADVSNGSVSDVNTAFQEVVAINTPHRFVVREQPVDVAKHYREADAKKQILRSDKRPKYTFLTPQEIKAKFGLGSDVPGSHKAPQQRRRHYRTLRSEHFTEEKRGQRILIPACWVGESEAEVKGKKYRVMLDL